MLSSRNIVEDHGGGHDNKAVPVLKVDAATLHCFNPLPHSLAPLGPPDHCPWPHPLRSSTPTFIAFPL